MEDYYLRIFPVRGEKMWWQVLKYLEPHLTSWNNNKQHRVGTVGKGCYLQLYKHSVCGGNRSYMTSLVDTSLVA